MDPDHPKRMQNRFKTIQLAVGEVHGENAAFAAASAAWLSTIQYFTLQALLSARSEEREVSDLEKEVEGLLKSFHSELCEFLGLDQSEIIRLSAAFREVVGDICQQKG